MRNNNKLMLTIQCITYNHESFIRQTLEGFVIQKTNFSFEAIVHDDASTDGTAAIILEYAEKYPDIIKPIIETENQYSKHDGSLGRIMDRHTYGKYVALCEGDDYWTDPYKLQKQVDFLETHPDYSLCFHNAIEHFENKEIKDSLFVKDVNSDKDFSGCDILQTWTIPTASVVFRKVIIDSPLYNKVVNERRFLVGDIVLFLTADNLGKLRFLNETMSVYRRHVGGITLSYDFENKKKWLQHDKALIDVFGTKYNCVNDMIFKLSCEIAHDYINEKKIFLAIDAILNIIYTYPVLFTRKILNNIFNRTKKTLFLYA